MNKIAALVLTIIALFGLGTWQIRYQERLAASISAGVQPTQQFKQADRYGGRQQSPEPTGPILPWLTFGVLAFQTWLAYRIWGVYSNQAEIMGGQLRALTEQGELARRDFLVTHRPRLVLRQAFSFITDPLDSLIVVNFIIANTGGSKCWITECHMGIELIRDPGYPAPPLMTPDMMYPSHVPFIGAIEPGERKMFGHTADNHRWDQDHRARWVPRTWGVHFVGHIEYIDEPGSGLKRHMAFRRKYDRATQHFHRIWDEENEHEYED